jgi:hypothetical protein
MIRLYCTSDFGKFRSCDFQTSETCRHVAHLADNAGYASVALQPTLTFGYVKRANVNVFL